MENKLFKSRVQKPPVNVHVLCRQVYKAKYEPVNEKRARHHCGVHFIMED